uniref:Uncharacterized protein n=1 Tax=Labrus bergylta TaxID=56723 RepID=A0A3Q3FGC0_9LABR
MSCAQFMAPLNMGGVTGKVYFNSTSNMATLNVSGAGSCGPLNLSLNVFPVKFGHFAQPCSEAHIGPSVHTFSANPESTLNLGDLSNKHMSLAGKNEVDISFQDFHLPLFGRNSIVGRSVVIHQLDGQSSVFMAIKSNRVGANNACDSVGGVFNPFNMSSMVREENFILNLFTFWKAKCCSAQGRTQDHFLKVSASDWAESRF